MEHGYFGAGAWPGCLSMACDQAWAWPSDLAPPRRPQAFLLVRASYVLGAVGEAPVMPADYSAVPELAFVSRVVAALADLPEAIAYFNPSGQCIRTPADFSGSLRAREEQGFPPLDVWCNARLFRLEDEAPEWSFMETVGLSQVDIADHEAWFPSNLYEAGEVARFLWNAALYVLQSGDVIAHGDTMDGPGGVAWRARRLEEGRLSPPRPVIRWIPANASNVPKSAIGRAPAVKPPQPPAPWAPRLPSWLRVRKS